MFGKPPLQVILLSCLLASLATFRRMDIFFPKGHYFQEAVVTAGVPLLGKNVSAVLLPRDATQGPIPHILWFTYSHNLLETQHPQVYYDNVIKTIQSYRSEWNEPNAPVNFLVDSNCSDLLVKVDQLENTTLAKAFEREYRGDMKADLCRLAALFLHGGYYFDIDLEVVKALPMDPKVSFSTVRDNLFGYFFQAFLAATPGHPVLRENLQTMMEFYVDRKGICFEKAQGVVGPCTLMKAWNQTSHRGHTRILRETHLAWHKLYPNMTQRGRGDACHWVIHDPEQMQVYFYSRIVGSTKCWSEG
jgi:mannosyltransferase OCH1-like enzyme